MPIPDAMRIGLVGQNPLAKPDPELTRDRALAQFVTEQAKATNNDFTPVADPKFDWRAKAMQAGASTQDLLMQSAINSAKNASAQFEMGGMGSAAGGGGKASLDAILRALRQKESSGNYGAINKDSGALGAYQVMPSNLQGNRGWDYEALGRNISTQEFLRNKQLQEQIVRHKFGNYLNQHGVKGALSSWYSGSPTRWNERTPQGAYPSVHNYVLSILKALGL